MNLPLRAFLSYAHEDRGLVEAFRKHLAVLRRSGVLQDWIDREMIAGDHVDKTISIELASAELVVLCVSSDFLDSDYCWEREMQVALHEHAKGRKKVVSIILRPCDWKKTPIASFLVLPQDGKPVTSWVNQDEAFTTVILELRRVIDQIHASRSESCEPQLRDPLLNPLNRGELLPVAYAAEVIQVGGEGSRVITKTAWMRVENDDGCLSPIENWVTTFFNRPGDLVWINCREGYEIFEVTVDDEKVAWDAPAAQYGLRVKDKLQNRVIIHCRLLKPNANSSHHCG